MTVASGIARRVAIVAESTYGTTPTSPSFATFRVKPGGGLSLTKKTEVLTELHSHGNPIDVIELGHDVSGSYEVVSAYGGALDSILEGALKGAFSTDVLWNGRTLKPFTIEETIQGTAANYLRFTGVEVEELSFSGNARETCNMSVSFQGRAMSAATSLLSGATYAAPTTTEEMTALSFAGISFVGLSTVPKIMGISVNIRHALTPIEEVGSKFRSGHVHDRIEVTGSVNTYFETKDALDVFLTHGSGSIAFTIGAVSTDKYTFTMPKVRLTAGTPSNGGTGPNMVPFDFVAVYDGTNGTIKIEREVA